MEEGLRGLEERGRLGETLVVFTSVHGEELLDHGYLGHAWTLYDEVLHVPLIIRGPAVLTPSRTEVRVSLVDLLPTLLNIYAIPHDSGGFDGKPFLAVENGRLILLSKDRLSQ